MLCPPPWAFDKVYSVRHKIPFSRVGLKSNQKEVSCLITTVPLLPKWAHHAWQVSNVARKVQPWVRPHFSLPSH